MTQLSGNLRKSCEDLAVRPLGPFSGGKAVGSYSFSKHVLSTCCMPQSCRAPRAAHRQLQAGYASRRPTQELLGVPCEATRVVLVGVEERAAELIIRCRDVRV